MESMSPAIVLLCLVAAADSTVIVESQGRDSQSIAAAIARVKPGDTVRLPEGTFELSEPIRPKSGIKLLGAGQEKTRLLYKGDKPGSFICLNGCEDMEIAHMTLDGQNNPLVYQGIEGSNSRRLRLHHLTIRDLQAKTWGPHAILFSGRNPTLEGGVTDSRISDCRIENIGPESEWGGGIRLAWGSAGNEVIGNTIHNTGRGGIFGDHSPELIIRNNRVSGSRGEGLGIEVWGHSDRAVIENNRIDHWLSIGGSDFCAVRRNVISDKSGSVKFIGIEGIGAHCIYTDNVVDGGQQIGLSVSNNTPKDFAYWGYNRVENCVQWASQFQGETTGIAYHYFYRCTLGNTLRGDPRARYPNDSGHGLRTNGACRALVFEDCAFQNNGGYGLQLGGTQVDALTFLRCTITGNGQAAVTGPSQYTAMEFNGCKVEGNKDDRLPAAKPFPSPPPVADFRLSEPVQAGRAAQFQCNSRAAGGIVGRLWDFGDGIPEVTEQPHHAFGQPGKYRVTLVVWNKSGRGGRVEKMIQVLPSP